MKSPRIGCWVCFSLASSLAASSRSSFAVASLPAARASNRPGDGLMVMSRSKMEDVGLGEGMAVLDDGRPRGDADPELPERTGCADRTPPPSRSAGGTTPGPAHRAWNPSRPAAAPVAGSGNRLRPGDVDVAGDAEGAAADLHFRRPEVDAVEEQRVDAEQEEDALAEPALGDLPQAGHEVAQQRAQRREAARAGNLGAGRRSRGDRSGDSARLPCCSRRDDPCQGRGRRGGPCLVPGNRHCSNKAHRLQPRTPAKASRCRPGQAQQAGRGQEAHPRKVASTSRPPGRAASRNTSKTALKATAKARGSPAFHA